MPKLKPRICEMCDEEDLLAKEFGGLFLCEECIFLLEEDQFYDFDVSEDDYLIGR